MKTIENELTTLGSNYEKIHREHQALNEELDKCRYDLEQVERSNIAHKERVS
jgi:predicted transcriptional regulator